MLEEIMTVPNSTGLTAKGDDADVAVQLGGTILQIIDDGVTFSSARPSADVRILRRPNAVSALMI